MWSVRTARRLLCSAAPAAAPRSRWERLRSSRAAVWCRSLLSDYKEACREAVVAARERPLKTAAYAALAGGAWACVRTKPDRSSFEAALLERSNRLGLLSPWIRSGASDGHVRRLLKLGNEGRLRYASLGLLCLVYRADHDPDAALYEARCSDLATPWRELPRRLLDVGFAGRWWLLDSKMEDYDVNPEEYRHLPPHMQAAGPPGPQQVERNERLHRDSWRPAATEEEETRVEDKAEAGREEIRPSPSSALG